MKYPCLVPERFCQTQIILEIAHEGINEYGEEAAPILYDGKCNYQDKARTVFTDEKKVVEITGTALFPGDICPQLSTISGGSAIVFGEKRRIQQGSKARNPDGTVNFTEVLII